MNASPPPPGQPVPAPEDAEWRALGITRETTERYRVGPYSYSNLPDAVAQAKRARVAGNDL